VKLAAILLAIICPGCGHIALGLHRRGFLLLFCCITFLGAALLAHVLLDGVLAVRFFIAGICFFGLIWLVSLMDILIGVRGMKAKLDRFELSPPGGEVRGAATDLYSRGRISYLRGGLEDARELFRESLKRDPSDSDALYQLARVSYELDDIAGARDLFKRYLEHDKASKWRGEAERYLEVIAPGEEGKKKNESREGSAR
jgi:tetratricopeptide (TPR) repeat protein